jgi:hypothetical protein
MKYTFVLHTTINNSITICVNSDITTKELHELFLRQLEINTVFKKKEILDIFAQDNFSNNVLSFPKTDDILKNYIENYRDYYPLSGFVKNKYNLYVIDIMYNEHISRNFCINPRSKIIKTNYMDDFLYSVKDCFHLKLKQS